MKLSVRNWIFLIFLPLLSNGIASTDASIDIIHYEFILAVNDSNNIIEGVAIIKIGFREKTDHFGLDLKNADNNGKGMKVHSVSISGKELKWNHALNKLMITLPSSAEPGDEAEVTVTYSGIPGDGLIISNNKFGERTFFSDHWPDRASNYLPVVDEPSDKATVDFVITAPAHYRVVANGYLLEESTLENGFSLTHWREEIPLPVKVMAFAVAPFSVRLEGVVDNIPVSAWVFSRNRIEGFSDYAIAVEPVKFYSKLIGPYPYEKLANVQSKTIFGGMENAGCIFYEENSVTGKGKAESLIAHEIAHQWFGNSVTEKEWHHVWLSEGFATYLTNVYTGNRYGSEKFNEAMASDRNRILRYDSRAHGSVVDTTITNLMRLLNPDSYQKGGWVLHMLRNEIGDSVFWNGMRIFYKRFMNGNALSYDFESVMEEVSGRDLKDFFNQWLYERDEPILKISSAAGKSNGTMKIVIEQEQSFLYHFRIDLAVSDSQGTRSITVPVSGKSTSIEIKADKNLKIIPDPEVKLLFRQATN